jgi:hypothetical protein
MSVVAGVRSLKAAVRKLEAAAVERQKNCVYCRYHREQWPLPKGRPAKPEEVATRRCEFCRARLTVCLPVEPLLYNYILRGFFRLTCEGLYTNRSDNAMYIWCSNMLAVIHIRLGYRDDGNKPRRGRRNFALEKLKRESSGFRCGDTNG